MPFERRSVIDTITAVINEPYVPVSELNTRIPQALVDIIHRALAKDPANRYQSIDEMAS